MIKILLSICFLSTMLMSECTVYACTPATNAIGDSTENVVESIATYSFESHSHYINQGVALPSDYTADGLCNQDNYNYSEYTYFENGTTVYDQIDVWMKSLDTNKRCYRTDLSHIYDLNTSQIRPITAADCSKSQYFDGSMCQITDCPIGHIPDSDYATTFTCHPDPTDTNTSTGSTDTNTTTGDTTGGGGTSGDTSNNTDSNATGTGTGTTTDSSNDTNNTDTSTGTTSTGTNTSDSSNDYTNILNQINSNISQNNINMASALTTISSDISASSQRNHDDLSTLNSSVDNFSETNHNDLSSISTKIDHTNASLLDVKSELSSMNDYMQSGTDNTEASDSLTNAQNQATSTISSITGSLNGIISSYTGSSPVVTGTGVHVFTTPPIYGKTITFDLSMFENLRQYFDILWLLMLAYFNFKMYVLIIRDLLKKF